MIPILYSPTTTTFDHNGLGLLMDTITCMVTEELNGLFELELTYPVDGIHADEIEVNCIIRAEPRENASVLEPFRVYRVSRTISGQITVYAQHMSYQLSYVPCMPVTKESRTASAALTAMMQAAAETCPVTFSTDITTTAEFGVKEPISIRAAIGGVEGSFLDTYGGEVLWQWPSVSILQNRGVESGLVIEFGRNMLDLVDDDSMAGVITGICPYCRNITDGNEEILTLTEKVLESSYADVFPFRRTVCVDLSDKFTDIGSDGVTEQQLREAATAYLDKNALSSAKFSIEVSFIGAKEDLGYTLLNANNVPSLGDTVTVKFSALSLSTKEKVTKTIYDVLLERYNSVTVGRPAQDLATTITNAAFGDEILI